MISLIYQIIHFLLFILSLYAIVISFISRKWWVLKGNTVAYQYSMLFKNINNNFVIFNFMKSQFVPRWNEPAFMQKTLHQWWNIFDMLYYRSKKKKKKTTCFRWFNKLFISFCCFRHYTLLLSFSYLENNEHWWEIQWHMIIHHSWKISLTTSLFFISWDLNSHQDETEPIFKQKTLHHWCNIFGMPYSRTN